MDFRKTRFGKKRSYSGRESNGRSKRSKSAYDSAPDANDTVYRILCPDKKIGGVIGKGGSIINALREETRAKIRVIDGIPGGDERVIIIYSPATGKPEDDKEEGSEKDDFTEKQFELMKPHCPAQEALLKVHDRIVVEEDQHGNLIHEANEKDDVIIARLLVPSSQVGCLLGKGGTIVQKLRSDTGANIRIMAAEHLSTAAVGTDELVQISGTLAVTKKALYEVSTLLHQNPPKDGVSVNHLSGEARNFYSSGAPPSGNQMWSQRNSGSRGPSSMPWFGGYGNERSEFHSSGFNSGPPRNSGEAAEFSMKILCSAEKTGGVIGKGGANVKQLQQETGTSIHVDAAAPDIDERVITVSAMEVPWEPRSPTIQAILQLQNKTSEFLEKGIVSTRLLISSSKIGCILGEGGQVITEMRRRTQADIRVRSKNDKPKCASPDEELVQISGSMAVAKDALMEIASRLRERCLRKANAGPSPAPLGRFQGFSAPPGGFSGRGPPPSGMMGAGNSSGYNYFKGGGDVQAYPIQASSSGYPNTNSSTEFKYPNNAMSSVPDIGGVSTIPNINQMAGARVKLQDPMLGASECVVEIHGSSQHMNAAQSLYQSYIPPGGPQPGLHQAALS